MKKVSCWRCIKLLLVLTSMLLVGCSHALMGGGILHPKGPVATAEQQLMSAVFFRNSKRT